MAKKKSPHGKKKGKKGPVVVEEKALDRFAGSSDEDDEHDGNHDTKEVQVNQDEPRVLHVEHDADEESGNEEEQDHARGRQEKNKSTSEKPFVTNTEAMVEEETEPGEKMAGAMARILGTFSTATTTTAATTKTASSVVLAKTVTPLQRLQQQEKDKEKALKQKRQANKERNLASLHIPLSVATTNTIGEGRHSITKELEQERFHRRVATRGVVALFNAIAQHQNVTEDDTVTNKKSEASKLTKHTFLDKIKNTAANIDAKKTKVQNKQKADNDAKEDSVGKWDALKDDFMMNPKKNWDEESSEEEANSEFEEPNDLLESDAAEEPQQNKRRKVSARE